MRSCICIYSFSSGVSLCIDLPQYPWHRYTYLHEWLMFTGSMHVNISVPWIRHGIHVLYSKLRVHWKMKLLMEEIQLNSWSHYFRLVLYIPGGVAGFLPSTEWPNQIQANPISPPRKGRRSVDRFALTCARRIGQVMFCIDVGFKMDGCWAPWMKQLSRLVEILDIIWYHNFTRLVLLWQRQCPGCNTVALHMIRYLTKYQPEGTSECILKLTIVENHGNDAGCGNVTLHPTCFQFALTVDTVPSQLKADQRLTTWNLLTNCLLSWLGIAWDMTILFFSNLHVAARQAQLDVGIARSYQLPAT